MPHNHNSIAPQLGDGKRLFRIEQAAFGRIINLLLFQGVWFLAVLGAAAGHGWVGAIALAVFMVTHGQLAGNPRADFRIAGVAMLIGAVAETALIQSGLISYASALPFVGFAPVWLLSLWGAFGLTMNSCIAWLQNRLLLAAFFGAIGGPLSYFGGVKLGAATTDHMDIVLAVIAVVYSLATPLLLKLAARAN